MQMQNTTPTKILALGGIEEIGKNMYVFEHSDELFIIDCGNKFCDENKLPGVSSIICSFDYLLLNKKKIKGLIITHAHEDHIGGIPYLLKTMNIPNIYASSLSLLIIKHKLKEHNDIKQPKFIEITDDFIIKEKYFTIDFFRVCHSIPLCYGVCLQTPNGNIVTCGDFRFDFFNKMEQTNIHKICNISKRGIDLLLCETTNAESLGFSTSEYLIINEIKKRLMNAKGRVLITTFASNLRRIENIIEIAKSLKKRICIIGKSMETNIKSSIQLNLIKTFKQDFVEPTDIKNIADRDLLIILTGSQGEPNAALNMMANGRYPHIVLKSSDTLLMSSNPIPGNFDQVEQLLNRLYKSGMKIYVNSKKNKLHASGHASQIELELMVKLINPKYIIPIHGEYRMLAAMKNNVSIIGFEKEKYIQIANGQIVELLNHQVNVTNNFVNTDEVYIDDNKTNVDNSRVLVVRKILSTDGIFNVTILIDRIIHKIIGIPKLITRGCFYANSYINLLHKIEYSIRDNIELEMSKNPKPIDNLKIRKIVEQTITYFIYKNKHKKPLVQTTIFDVHQ